MACSLPLFMDVIVKAAISCCSIDTAQMSQSGRTCYGCRREG